LAVFELLRQKRQGRHGFLYASDLLELDGKDLKREPFEVRKATLASMLAKAAPGGRTSISRTRMERSCFAKPAMRLEGFVSKLRDSPYRSGRSPDWPKSKNPASVAAASREAEEDWYN
jgi:bifunctional non-homologous end joining protein LigD